MDILKAREIVLVAAAAWAAEKMSYDRDKFRTRPYLVQKATIEVDPEHALNLRAEVLDAAILQCAREIARREAAGNNPA